MMQNIAPRYISRREFVQSAGRILAASSALLLSACGLNVGSSTPTPSANPTVPSNTNTRVKLPTYVPFSGPPPDVAGIPDGSVPGGYFRYPQSRPRAVPQAPGRGGDVTILTRITNAGGVKPVESNSAWQAINSRLNANIKLNVVAIGDYPTRLATTLAGGDIPDIAVNVQTVPSAPDLLKAQFADLTAYVSGDAIKDYPNLANIPTRSWSQTVFNNGIYAIPIPAPPFGSTMVVHQELLDQAGVAGPKNAGDLKRILQTVTKPDAGVWGMSALYTYGLDANQGSWMTGMFGAPMQWALSSDGKLTRDIETDAFKAAVPYVRDLVDSGVYHPSTLQYTPTQADTEWRAGKFVIFHVAFIAGYLQDWTLSTKIPNFKLRLLDPIGFDGGKPVSHLGPANFGLAFVKKASADRVKELLGILNFLAAPFGTEEHLLINYGLEGSQFNFDANGNPVVTDEGKTQVPPAVPWLYVAAGAPVLYNPNKSQEFVTVYRAAEMAMLDVGVTDPTVGLYSPTDSRQGLVLMQTFWDGMAEICRGQRPVSDLDGLVNAWRAGGGDKMREEYQAAA
jgi:putative aldouronate transport system substrate-binding protein